MCCFFFFFSYLPAIFRWIYEKFKIPLVPIYGGFPVKFRTYLGDPIHYDPSITASELAEKVRIF